MKTKRGKRKRYVGPAEFEVTRTGFLTGIGMRLNYVDKIGGFVVVAKNLAQLKAIKRRFVRERLFSENCHRAIVVPYEPYA